MHTTPTVEDFRRNDVRLVLDRTGDGPATAHLLVEQTDGQPYVFTSRRPLAAADMSGPHRELFRLAETLASAVRMSTGTAVGVTTFDGHRTLARWSRA